MKLIDFKNRIKQILSLISLSIEIDNSDGVFSIINNPTLNNFVICRITQNGIEFSLFSDREKWFLIKKKDELLEDPPLYYLNDIYLNHSLSFLLIELAKWVCSIGKFEYTHKNFNVYLKVRQLFPVLIAEKSYITTLRLNKENNAMVVVNGDVSFTILAQKQEVLDGILNELEIKKDNIQKIEYKSTIVTNGTVCDNYIEGEIIFLNIPTKVKIVIINKIPTDKIVELRIKKWVDNISKDKFLEIKDNISRKIVYSTFSQTNGFTKLEMNSKIKLLFNDLEIHHLVVDDDYLGIYFKSCNLYPDNLIVCLLNQKMFIEDYYIE